MLGEYLMIIEFSLPVQLLLLARIDLLIFPLRNGVNAIEYVHFTENQLLFNHLLIEKAMEIKYNEIKNSREKAKQ